MNTTSLNVRISAAVASLAVVVAILGGIGALAEPPVASSLFAQAATTVIVR